MTKVLTKVAHLNPDLDFAASMKSLPDGVNLTMLKEHIKPITNDIDEIKRPERSVANLSYSQRQLCNAPALKREMVVHEEGEIMQTEQDPTIELSKVSMDLTVLHCPLCLLPLTPPMYECKGGHLTYADCRIERPGNQQQCQKCERGGGFDVWNTVVDAVLSSFRVECPHEGCGLYITYHKLADHQSVCPLVPCKCPVPICGYEGPPPALYHHVSTTHPMPEHRIQAGASPLPHYVAKMWANGPLGEPKGMTDGVKVEMEVTSSKDLGGVAVQELTFFTVPPKLLAGAKLVSLHIQIDKLTS
ncbi:E3 ubiquitin-protein ligase SINA-like 3 [Triticum dicoccoides]|uniref:E3 ubiquitin-protein ligase SINA-like 3 n=1 Tax=Triticum dicoccoides TaxID=85692 RepID=UPI001891F0A9|nr:E3 ubiquitin-protein ligase SINA-like 3 [Triticum dicoccoides]